MLPPAPRTGASAAAERLAAVAARALWPAVSRLSTRFARPPFQPTWAPAPLIRSGQTTAPPFGWPRQTDSLCPECVRLLREAVACGRLALEDVKHDRTCLIKAHIVERDGRVLMVKRCPMHGEFEDVLSIDAEFLGRIERLFAGRDFEADGGSCRDHGVSSVRYGRGAVLTVDLTNRCNLNCQPCFMDASSNGGASDLDWNEIRALLDRCVEMRPRRQMSVQFSGGEPTLSPHFLDSIRYARDLGYFCVQCASNGVRFGQDASFCHDAKAAGLRLCYLQFDGVPDAPASAAGSQTNLAALKQRAVDNLHAAGIDVVLVPTIVGGRNNDQIGRIIEFAIRNAEKITVVSFQPVSFSGRYESIDPDLRRQQRYTLSHLVHDVRAQLGMTEPLRDWFPLSSMNPFSDLVDLVLGPSAEFGALKCGCHPHCGVGTVLLVHKHTGRAIPVTRFLDLERLLDDLRAVTDAGHGRLATLAQAGLAVLRNLRPDELPEGYGMLQLLRQLTSQVGASGDRIGATEGDSTSYPWRFLFVAGMWFQDLYTYDFRRTEMCIIPYGTPHGEISFCAYNTGIGWRQLLGHARCAATTDMEAKPAHRPAAAGRNLRTRHESPPGAALLKPERSHKRLPVVD